ncbi:MAG: type II secretion system minor pseudopilin GspK [Desulfobacteraceae bacterium]|nr:type II secretion system minor pseudopilin GspK [Desulfobacteraceae bacterium]
MKSPLRNSRGVALILTILIVSLIIAVTLQFNRTMRTHVASAANVAHGLKALYAAKSGISYSLALLMEDSREVDTLLDQWAVEESLDRVSGALRAHFSCSLSETKEKKRLVSIEDLSGKIQINRLVENHELEKVFKRFLKLDEFGLDQESINVIVDSVMDWIDQADQEDDLVRFYGAEDDYYQSLERPYHCKNGPMDSPGELLLVKGITPELFSRIKPYITVFGEDGKININTADPMVLTSLHEDMDMGMAELMVDHRDNADEDALRSTTWYHDAGVPKDIKIPKEIIATTSNHFRITADGCFGHTTKRITTAVKRGDKEDFRTLSWKIE